MAEIVQTLLVDCILDTKQMQLSLTYSTLSFYMFSVKHVFCVALCLWHHQHKCQMTLKNMDLINWYEAQDLSEESALFIRKYDFDPEGQGLGKSKNISSVHSNQTVVMVMWLRRPQSPDFIVSYMSDT